MKKWEKVLIARQNHRLTICNANFSFFKSPTANSFFRWRKLILNRLTPTDHKIVWIYFLSSCFWNPTVLICPGEFKMLLHAESTVWATRIHTHANSNLFRFARSEGCLCVAIKNIVTMECCWISLLSRLRQKCWLYSSLVRCYLQF